MSGHLSIHPLTLASIEMQRDAVFPDGSRRRIGSACGCELRAGKWWLCGYHDGFEDSIAAMAEHHPKVDVTLTLAGELTSRLVCPRCDEPWPCPAITPEPRPMPDLHPTIPFPRCACGRPAVETVAGQPCCGDDR